MRFRVLGEQHAVWEVGGGSCLPQIFFEHLLTGTGPGNSVLNETNSLPPMNLHFSKGSQTKHKCVLWCPAVIQSEKKEQEIRLRCPVRAGGVRNSEGQPRSSGAVTGAVGDAERH